MSQVKESERGWRWERSERFKISHKLVWMPQPVGMYSWEEEDERGVSITIPIGFPFTSKDVDVKVSSTWIRAGLKKKPPILSGKLFQPVSSDSVWQIEKAEQSITIHLEKEYENSWPILIVGPGPSPADKLDPQSLHNIGVSLEGGRGYLMNLNDSDALKYYTEAAEMDFVPSLMRLAEASLPEQKIPVDFTSVSLSNSIAGLSADPDRAMEFYKKAANLGYADAQAQVAFAYHSPSLFGANWPADVNLAREWAQKAADNGSANGYFVLGSIESSLGKADKAVEYFKRAGDHHAPALHNLAWYQVDAFKRLRRKDFDLLDKLKGQGGLKPDRAEAMKLFEKANRIKPRWLRFTVQASALRYLCDSFVIPSKSEIDSFLGVDTSQPSAPRDSSPPKAALAAKSDPSKPDPMQSSKAQPQAKKDVASLPSSSFITWDHVGILLGAAAVVVLYRYWRSAK
ncbi:hypothetical protein GUITHDRAFT_102790 [Guillardia theta CCMP2712]|uniref:CS domain-containing protein n=1 Tax=Guillardia theta (strain CCMP2712) TaxID=905079 RepID=L1JSI8_GUITC|nr:hypothetical protein GUITHDRAFT_102790 [Guillardia theta CCMP2712]EKX51526.1 hypothetical protein GUITHDRAFT_102790 [Guillardia theta CCMP2712]|eukprot:XP_005838506.1 hypothetical protein GUITHDRAFT_102790 [Guillardia theta CCMP2712]